MVNSIFSFLEFLLGGGAWLQIVVGEGVLPFDVASARFLCCRNDGSVLLVTLTPSNRSLARALLPAAAADKGKNKDQGPIMRAPLEHNACPICGAAPINNPAMFPTAYVACFVCAQDYVEREARCPVTRERVRGGVSALRKVLG
ncbi:unnamed protein product [Tilletia controversa]|nr:unnamed protein product [Tilletia controversa]CAD6960478.1 unnamed protein product [Tilletia controversa]